jgi:hypothetical protein
MPTVRRRGASLLVPPRSDAGTHPSAGPPGHALPVDVSELKLVAAGVVVELDLDVADRSRVLGGDEYLEFVPALVVEEVQQRRRKLVRQVGASVGSRSGVADRLGAVIATLSYPGMSGYTA